MPLFFVARSCPITPHHTAYLIEADSGDSAKSKFRHLTHITGSVECQPLKSVDGDYRYYQHFFGISAVTYKGSNSSASSNQIIYHEWYEPITLFDPLTIFKQAMMNCGQPEWWTDHDPRLFLYERTGLVYVNMYRASVPLIAGPLEFAGIVQVKQAK